MNRRQFIAAGLAWAATTAWGQGRQSAPPASARQHHHDVLILGAGLAGLTAARQLAAQGANCLVLEARERPGGRVHTALDLPDRPEYGAVEVGGSYVRLRALASELGLELAPPAKAASKELELAAPATAGQRHSGLTLHLNGATFPDWQWPDSPQNPLRGVERKLLPHLLERHYLGQANPLKDDQEWDQPALADRDRSIGTVMRSRGASENALKLAEIAGNHNGQDSVSALPWWRTQLLFQKDRISEHFSKGSSALPLALASQLRERIRYRTQVEGIRAGARGIVVQLAGGERLAADFCICTLPLPALAKLNLDLPVPMDLQEALRQHNYTRISVLQIDTPAFWEQDGMAPAMWTDTPLERLFPRVEHGSGQIVGLKAFVNGAGADRLSGMAPASLEQSVSEIFRRIRPASGGRVRIAGQWHWGVDPYAGGAYSNWRPGRVARDRAAVRRPLGRLLFAGEHTADAPGMEGAIRSGEAAVRQLLNFAETEAA